MNFTPCRDNFYFYDTTDNIITIVRSYYFLETIKNNSYPFLETAKNNKEFSTQRKSKYALERLSMV